ncbi:hypothetical protein RAS1_26610 [Phycisphaerae bacterium RAS1]|nr:hypothetical protein RAS1_26610 [Phycisphaerae bacterium RAS1]
MGLFKQKVEVLIEPSRHERDKDHECIFHVGKPVFVKVSVRNKLDAPATVTVQCPGFSPASQTSSIAAKSDKIDAPLGFHIADVSGDQTLTVTVAGLPAETRTLHVKRVVPRAQFQSPAVIPAKGKYTAGEQVRLSVALDNPALEDGSGVEIVALPAAPALFAAPIKVAFNKGLKTPTAEVAFNIDGAARGDYTLSLRADAALAGGKKLSPGDPKYVSASIKVVEPTTPKVSFDPVPFSPQKDDYEVGEKVRVRLRLSQRAVEAGTHAKVVCLGLDPSPVQVDFPVGTDRAEAEVTCKTASDRPYDATLQIATKAAQKCERTLSDAENLWKKKIKISQSVNRTARFSENQPFVPEEPYTPGEMLRVTVSLDRPAGVGGARVLVKSAAFEQAIDLLIPEGHQSFSDTATIKRDVDGPQTAVLELPPPPPPPNPPPQLLLDEKFKLTKFKVRALPKLKFVGKDGEATWIEPAGPYFAGQSVTLKVALDQPAPRSSGARFKVESTALDESPLEAVIPPGQSEASIGVRLGNGSNGDQSIKLQPETLTCRVLPPSDALRFVKVRTAPKVTFSRATEDKIKDKEYQEGASEDLIVELDEACKEEALARIKSPAFGGMVYVASFKAGEKTAKVKVKFKKGFKRPAPAPTQNRRQGGGSQSPPPPPPPPPPIPQQPISVWGEMNCEADKALRNPSVPASIRKNVILARVEGPADFDASDPAMPCPRTGDTAVHEPCNQHALEIIEEHGKTDSGNADDKDQSLRRAERGKSGTLGNFVVVYKKSGAVVPARPGPATGRGRLGIGASQVGEQWATGLPPAPPALPPPPAQNQGGGGGQAPPPLPPPQALPPPPPPPPPPPEDAFVIQDPATIQMIAGRDPKHVAVDLRAGAVDDERFHGTWVTLQLDDDAYFCNEPILGEDGEPRRHPIVRVKKLGESGEWLPVEVKKPGDVHDDAVAKKKLHKFRVYRGKQPWDKFEPGEDAGAAKKGAAKVGNFLLRVTPFGEILSAIANKLAPPIQKYEVWVDTCGSVDAARPCRYRDNPLAPPPAARRMRTILEVYPSDEFCLKLSIKPFPFNMWGVEGEKLEPTGELKPVNNPFAGDQWSKQSGFYGNKPEPEQLGGASQHDSIKMKASDAISTDVAVGDNLQRQPTEEAVTVEEDDVTFLKTRKERSSWVDGAMGGGVGAMGSTPESRQALWSAPKKRAFHTADKSKLPATFDDVNDPDYSKSGEFAQGLKKFLDRVEVSLTMNGRNERAFNDIAKAIAAIVYAVKGTLDVLSSVGDMIPSWGWSFQISAGFLEGDLSWRWGWKEYEDHRVFSWNEIVAKCTLFRISAKLDFGARVSVLVAKCEAVIYIQIMGALSLDVSYETPGPEFSDSLGPFDVGFTATTKAEAGANIVLIHEHFFQFNAAIRTGFAFTFRFLRVPPKGSPGVMYERRFLGLTWGITFNLICVKEIRKEWAIIKPNPPEFPAKTEILFPKSARTGYAGTRFKLTDTWRRIKFEYAKLESVLAGWHDFQMAMVALRDPASVTAGVKWPETEYPYDYESGHDFAGDGAFNERAEWLTQWTRTEAAIYKWTAAVQHRQTLNMGKLRAVGEKLQKHIPVMKARIAGVKKTMVEFHQRFFVPLKQIDHELDEFEDRGMDVPEAALYQAKNAAKTVSEAKSLADKPVSEGEKALGKLNLYLNQLGETDLWWP